MTWRMRGWMAAVAVLAAASCGGSSPTSPSNTPAPGGGGGGTGSGGGGGTSAPQVCRTVATSNTSVTTAANFSATINQNCAFNTASGVGSCTGQYSDSFGTRTTTSTATNYGSTAAFVDEVAVIPPLTKYQSSSGSQTNASGGTTSGSSVNTFDGQGRIVSTVDTSSSGVSTTTYSAWDAAGRPTVARDQGSGFDNRRDISYDDGARTRTTRVNGGVVVTVETFDANGNPSMQTASGGASSSTTVITTTATQRVCK